MSKITKIILCKCTQSSIEIVHLRYLRICWPTCLRLRHQPSLLLLTNQLLIGSVKTSSNYLRRRGIWVITIIWLCKSSHQKLVFQSFWFLVLTRMVSFWRRQITLSQIFLFFLEQFVKTLNNKVFLIMRPTLSNQPLTSFSLMRHIPRRRHLIRQRFPWRLRYQRSLINFDRQRRYNPTFLCNHGLFLNLLVRVVDDRLSLEVL